MKIRVEVITGRVIVKEVESWGFWGDGVKAYDGIRACILYVPQEQLVAFEVIDEDEEKE